MALRGSATSIGIAVVLAGMGLMAGGCSGPATSSSPLKALSGFGGDAAIAKKAQSDPFPSAAQQGLAAPSNSR